MALQWAPAKWAVTCERQLKGTWEEALKILWEIMRMSEMMRAARKGNKKELHYNERWERAAVCPLLLALLSHARWARPCPQPVWCSGTWSLHKLTTKGVDQGRSLCNTGSHSTAFQTQGEFGTCHQHLGETFPPNWMIALDMMRVWLLHVWNSTGCIFERLIQWAQLGMYLEEKEKR